MPLAAGLRLGSYEVVAPLGAGGMGEVYRATDTRLDRSVALKTLPPGFALDADRRARFEREAKTLATLNHPHIAQVYGLEEVPGVDGAPPTLALAMELVEGEDLAARIARGPLPLDEAMPLARQIAEGLEAAHEAGIVHRDLKPANIRVTPEGVVKVLDFGLAKPVAGAAGSGGAAGVATHSPTIMTSPAMTLQGVILGTAPYMAPEQAKGRAVDRRADIWAFGCVLYELLTGKRAFDGEDVTEILGAIVKTEPDWIALPTATPRSVRRLLERCLAKDKTQRLQHIGDARLELSSASREETETTSGVVSPGTPLGSRWSTRAGWVAAGLATMVALALAIAMTRPVPAPPTPMTAFAVPLPADIAFTNLGRHVLALSPDGTTLVFVANLRLYRRDLATNAIQPIPGTDSRRGVLEPTFSPDGEWVAYYANDDGAIKRIRPDGSGAQVVCQAQAPYGMSWGRKGILFGQVDKGILRCPGDGGLPSVVAPVSLPKVAASPHEMPGTNRVAFSLADGESFDRWDRGAVMLHDEDTGEQRQLVPSATDSFVAGQHLFYRTGTTLFAVRLGGDGLSTAGAPATIVRGVRVPTAPDINPPTGHYTATSTGVFAYLRGNELEGFDRVLAMLDGKGAIRPLAVPPGDYSYPRVSPDGRFVAYVEGTAGDSNIWIHEIGASGPPRKLTFDGASTSPIWSSDGQWIYFHQRGSARGIARQRADGTAPAELVLQVDSGVFPEAALPDGSAILFSQGAQGGRWTLRALSTRDRTVRVLGDGLESSGALGASVSRDGRWLAYTVSEGQAVTSFVAPFPPTGVKYELPSRQEASHAVWLPDGRSLLYTDYGRRLQIDAVVGNTIRLGQPRAVERGPIIEGTAMARRNLDVMPDTGWLLAVAPADLKRNVPEGGDRQIEVVLNWPELLRPRATSPP